MMRPLIAFIGLLLLAQLTETTAVAAADPSASASASVSESATTQLLRLRQRLHSAAAAESHDQGEAQTHTQTLVETAADVAAGLHGQVNTLEYIEPESPDTLALLAYIREQQATIAEQLQSKRQRHELEEETIDEQPPLQKRRFEITVPPTTTTTTARRPLRQRRTTQLQLQRQRQQQAQGSTQPFQLQSTTTQSQPFQSQPFQSPPVSTPTFNSQPFQFNAPRPPFNPFGTALLEAEAEAGAGVSALVYPQSALLAHLRNAQSVVYPGTTVPVAAGAAPASPVTILPVAPPGPQGSFAYALEGGAPYRVLSAVGFVALGAATHPSNEATQFCDAIFMPTLPNVGFGQGYSHNLVLRNRYLWETGHLIGAALGGSNAEPLNFVPMHRITNRRGARWGEAETLALALKTICPGMAAPMRVRLNVNFNYPAAVPVPAGQAATPLMGNQLIPSDGTYRITVNNGCANVIEQYCTAVGMPALVRMTHGGPGPKAAGACAAAAVPAAAGLPGAMAARWGLVRAFYRHATCVNGGAARQCSWTTNWTNQASDAIGFLGRPDVHVVP